MREFGVRRYGDTNYRHCMAESATAAANWFAHAEAGIADKDFQALVMDPVLPIEGVGARGDNPQTIYVRHGPLTESGRNATDLNRRTPLHR
jgi:hypothetical protein